MQSDSTSSGGFASLCKKVWNDPVGSKVIATIIVAVPTWVTISYVSWKNAQLAILLVLMLAVAVVIVTGRFKRLFEKAPPFKQEDIIVLFKNPPQINLDDEQNIFKFEADISIINFTSYEICIFSGECHTVIGGYVFLSLERSNKVALPPRATASYHFEKNINENEVKRALGFFQSPKEGNRDKCAHCEFNFSVTVKGINLDKIYTPSQPICISLIQRGKPETSTRTITFSPEADLPPPKTDIDVLSSDTVISSTEMAEREKDTTPDSPSSWYKIIGAVFAREFDEAEKIFKLHQETLTDADTIFKDEAFYLFLKGQLGDTGAFQTLQEKTKHQTLSALAFSYIGKIYEQTDNYVSALSSYEKAIQNAKSDEERANNLVAAARCNFHLGKKEIAVTSIISEIRSTTEREILPILYGGLASLYEMSKEYDLRALALEKALEIKANDSDLIFQIAYAYSESKQKALALLHYKSLLLFDPKNQMGLNNVGIVYENLQMPLRSIKHFMSSLQLSNTLAAANISYRYIDAGFEEEALTILHNAKQQNDYHSNIDSAISTLYSRKAEEERREESVIQGAREQRKFFLSYAEVYFSGRGDNLDLSGLWRFPNGTEISMQQEGKRFVAQWGKDVFQNEIDGTITNCTATLRTNYLSSASWKDNTGYAYLSLDGNEMFAMLLCGDSPKFFQLKRIN